MTGCSVLTLPSSISGKPVCSATSFTGIPASVSIFADPPVERISTPCLRSICANSTRPVLSETEMSARRIFTWAWGMWVSAPETKGSALRHRLQRPFYDGLSGPDCAFDDDLLGPLHVAVVAEPDALRKTEPPADGTKSPAAASRKAEKHRGTVLNQRGLHPRMQVEAD